MSKLIEKFVVLSDIESRIEPFLYKELSEEKYLIKEVDSIDLLTWNRLDLAFKLFYLDMKRDNKKLAEEVYHFDIKSQTLGSFSEHGNRDKITFDKYIQDFNSIYSSIRSKGFLSIKSLLPLSGNKTIRNGAHRLASAIQLKKEVVCVEISSSDFIVDYNYYFDRDVPQNIIEMCVNKFIEYSNNVYLAFLWPSGRKMVDDSLSLFPNIVYSKEIQLTSKGGYNLLSELYKHMDWIGDEENNYSGLNQKLVECFTDFDKFTVIAFQEESLDKVQDIKTKVRDINGIGFSSIHITDTKEESVRISQLIFNKNGLHFLNYSNPYRYSNYYKELDKLLSSFNGNIKKKDFIIDSSSVLTVYGIRKNHDIDLLFSDKNKSIPDLNIVSHDSELIFHKKTKTELLYDQRNFFIFLDYKYISFNQLYRMKKNRNESKDINDSLSMDAFVEDNSLQLFCTSVRQRLLYLKIKLRHDYYHYRVIIAKRIGLYKVLKRAYHKLLKD